MENNNLIIKPTYFKLTSQSPDNPGIFEIDLVSATQKGEEIRYVSISITGINLKNGQEQESFISIDNEEDFKKFKDFVSQLEWKK